MIMLSLAVKVRFVLESLELKNNPLFTHIKAYLLSEGGRQLVT